MNTCVLLTEIIKPILSFPQDLYIEDNLEENKRSFLVHVASIDMKKIVSNGGRIFKSLKTLLICSLKDQQIELIINIIH